MKLRSGKTPAADAPHAADRHRPAAPSKAGHAKQAPLPHVLQLCPELIEGARKHYEKSTTNEQTKELMAKLKKGQAPKIFCVSCSDSRVNVPMLFDLTFGEVFEHRNMGNLLPRSSTQDGFVDASLLATIEYAISVLKVDFLLILGHTGCGLVKAVMDRARAHGDFALPEHVATWADHAGEIKGRVDQHYEGLSNEQADLAAVGENVLRQLDRLRSLPVVRQALERRDIKGVLGAVYEVTNHGVISWWNDDVQRFVATEGTTSIPDRQAEVSKR